MVTLSRQEMANITGLTGRSIIDSTKYIMIYNTFPNKIENF